MKIRVFFWIVTLSSDVQGTNVSEDHTASIFSVKIIKWKATHFSGTLLSYHIATRVLCYQFG